MKSAPMILSVLTALAIAGCGGSDKQAKEPEQGPAESAGEKVDNAAEKTEETVEEGAEKAGDEAEKAGDKVEDATD